jgi:wyosine [tRNA(Phe)-imidazoG37] synthetase (radical SAM superfamily)
MPLRWSDVIYGPVFSRRLGRSLGINLLPRPRKTCSFDCVYCEHGLTDILTLARGSVIQPSGEGFPDAVYVLEAVEAGLTKYSSLDHLTFSGNGEPTLHPHFTAIVEGVRALRNRLHPSLRLAVFSNSTTVMRPEILEALALVDAPILKLDAGDEDTWRAINRPPPGIALERVLEGLSLVPNLALQCLFLDGAVQNVRGRPYQAWLEAVGRVRPKAVQIYSLDRPTPEHGLQEVPLEELTRIAREVFERTAIPAQAY